MIAAVLTGRAVEDDSGCWVWTNAVNSSGYGHSAPSPVSGTALAHRIAYEALVGPSTGNRMCLVCRAESPSASREAVNARAAKARAKRPGRAA